MRLTQEKNYAQGSGVQSPGFSFFNELDTEKKKAMLNPQISVSFFNELATERKTMLMTLFHFLTSLPQRRKLCS
jgi:hypothetical protein